MSQNHLLDTASDRLEVPGHPDLWVEFRRELSFTEDLVLEQRRQDIASRGLVGEDGARRLDARLIAEFALVRAAAMVTGWNLLDGQGQPLPISGDGLACLNKDVLGFISDEASRRLAGRPEEKEAPFETPSQPSS